MRFCLYFKAVVVLAYDNIGAVNQNCARSGCIEGRFTREGNYFDVLEGKPMIYSTHVHSRTVFGQMDIVASVSHSSSINCVRSTAKTVHLQYSEPPTHYGAEEAAAPPFSTGTSASPVAMLVAQASLSCLTLCSCFCSLKPLGIF